MYQQRNSLWLYLLLVCLRYFWHTGTFVLVPVGHEFLFCIDGWTEGVRTQLTGLVQISVSSLVLVK